MARARSSPIADWMNQHKEEVQKYAGKRIAVDPQLGIVAASDNIDDIRRTLEARGLLGKVVIYTVPPSSGDLRALREQSERLRLAQARVLSEAEKLVEEHLQHLPKSFVEAVEAWQEARGR